MVWLPQEAQEGSLTVQVQDTIQQGGKKHCFVQLSPDKTIESIFKEISKDLEYNVDDIEIILRKGSSSVSIVNKYKEECRLSRPDFCRDFLSVLLGRTMA